MTTPTNKLIEEAIEEIVECNNDGDDWPDEGLNKILTTLLTKHEDAVLEEIKVCNRKGVHTCRLGAIHLPNNFCGTLKTLTTDPLRANQSDHEQTKKKITIQ